jgi:hypothetical protein
MQLIPQLSASDAIIKFNGYESGWLSSIRFNQNFNLRPVKHLRTDKVQGFVRGISDVSITANQGFIELGTVFGSLVDIATIYDSLKGLSSNDVQTQAEAVASLGKELQTLNDALGNPIGNFIDGILDSAGGIGEAIRGIFGLAKEPQDKVKDAIKASIYQGGANNMLAVFSDIYFDIEILSPVEKTFNSLPFRQTPLWTLKDCKISAQNVNISTDSVIIMRDIQIVCREVQESFVEKEVFKAF